MIHDRQDLIALIGSRICHDLISPLGAISNGLELIEMSGTSPTPEFDLIRDSIANANSKIRFFRIAYGKAENGATLARSEIASVLDDYFHGSRLTVLWHPVRELQRRDVKRAFLAIQCLESALPRGGEISVTSDGHDWILTAETDRVKTDPACWALLEGHGSAEDLSPAQVQFGMLAMLSRWRKPGIRLEFTESRIVMQL